MQFTISSLTGPSALESLPNELLLRIMSHAILAPSITSDLSLASSASDPSIDQINSDLLSAPRVSISPSFGQRAPPHGLTDIQALCVTSRRLHEFAGTMLYRCAVLETEKSGLLFRAEADWGVCLKDTEVPGHASCLDGRGVEEQASQRCGACLPPTPVEWHQSSPHVAGPLAPKVPQNTHFLSNVNHLRVAEPQASLLTFSPKLTYVSLPRRCNANAENDSVFLDSVKACQPSIKSWSSSSHLSRLGTIEVDIPDLDADNVEEITTSSIWESAQDLMKHDERLFVIP
ncbi:hypothetical protein PAXINDRAFT_99413 [Paxillus involutus ATCC 200175]|uniref:Uncharacterized protein n=1 Tax=Paxillus involutus ATCC 200175 TaxID=664439 RepID=A0A0C9U944_PAXIN|nr:hypothetical protein PAXINDRAFT_99413 [Paxillus involutus ATCC 200175]